MYKLSDLIVMVADSEPKSIDRMCTTLLKLGVENLVCAEDAEDGEYIASELRSKGQTVSILFCNHNLEGLSVNDFVTNLTRRHPNLISITYSKCIDPSNHMRALFESSAVDYIAQDQKFEDSVRKVANRWFKAAKLHMEYVTRYGSALGA